MRAGGDHATAEQERLALYLLGAMDDAERESFEEHLAGCWHCLDEAAAIGPSLSGLAGLDDADWLPPPAADPPAAPSPPGSAAPPPSGSAAPPPSGSAAPADTLDAMPSAGGDAATRERGDVDGPSGSVRPAGARPGGTHPSGARPASTRAGSRRRRRAVWVGAAAAVIALALAGGVVAVNEWNAGDAPVLTASGEAPGYGASLSVAIIAGDKGRSTIRITATGLRPGIRYRLFAVTRDGATHVVRDWTASSGPQEVAGETSLSVDDLSFITVGLVNGSAIVTAPIYRDPASPR
ncbi:zf-HC2 domain-containing protein [Micromonosporaceae bacterium B7E4]